MHEILEQVWSYVRATWRYRWYIQLVAWPICIGGWLLTLSLPDQYEATARLFVDTKSMLRPLLQGLAVDTNIDEEIQVITRTMLSRPNLEKIVRETDLDISATTPQEMEGLLQRLQRAISIVNRNSGDRLYSINFVHDDPRKAKAVVETLMSLLVESTLGGARQDVSSAQRFLDEQIKEYETRLTQAEERLKEFKQHNVGRMPTEGRGYYERLQGEMALLEQARLELQEAERRRDELRRQLVGEEPTFGMVGTPTVDAALTTSVDGRIATLRERMDDLRLQFTDDHPDIVALQHTIDQLEKQRRDELDRASSRTQGRTPTTALETNPVYQQMKIALGQAEADVAAFQVRVKGYQKRVAELQAMVGTIPEVEAELARLNRDYNVNRQNYEALLGRRETANLSDQADQSADDIKFKIIDPPRVSLEPVGPNRLLFGAVVLIGGIVLGAGLAVFISRLKPTIDTSQALRKLTGFPVLGVVSITRSAAELRKQRIEVLYFAFVSLLLCGIFVAFVATQVVGYTVTSPFSIQ